MSSPYRNEGEVLRERRATLESSLAELRQRRLAIADIRAQEAAIETELAAIHTALAALTPRTPPTPSTLGAPRRSLPLLDGLRVASPCDMRWDDMVGDDRTRSCSRCAKDVYDISAMTSDEAEAFLQEQKGACVFFARRLDGTIVTQDCPVGAKTKERKKRLVAATAAAFGAVATALTAAAAMTPDAAPRQLEARRHLAYPEHRANPPEEATPVDDPLLYVMGLMGPGPFVDASDPVIRGRPPER